MVTPILNLKHCTVAPHLLAADAERITKKAGREILPENSTSSLKDEIFGQYRGRPVTPRTAAVLADPTTRVQRSSEAIENHLERRLTLLFLQMVLCHGTGSTFSEGRTLHQGYSAQTIKLPGRGRGMEFQAAHTATLPSLYVQARGSDEKTVFLYRSGFYDQSNQTDDLIVAVNRADTAIDGKHSEMKLRTKTVNILNRASNATVTPEQATQEFAADMLTEIERVMAAHPNPNDETRMVLDIYHRKAIELQCLVTDPKTFDKWLNLQMDDPMLRLADGVIRQIATAQEVSPAELRDMIYRKVYEVPAIIRSTIHRVLNESRAPNHFINLYLLQILRRCQGDVRPALEGILGKTLAQAEADARDYHNIGKTNQLLRVHSARIDALYQEIRPLLLKLQGQDVGQVPLIGLSQETRASLRPGVYQLRYRMIRSDQEVQGRIKRAFEAALNNISKSRPQYLESFFQAALIGAARTDKERKTLTGLLNVSLQECEQATREARVNTNAHAALNQHASLINGMGSDLHNAFRNGGATPAFLDAWRDRSNQLFHQITSSKNAGNLELLYNRRLFDYVEEPAAQRWLAAHIGSTQAQLDQRIAARITAKGTLEADRLLAPHLQTITTVARNALRDVENLRTETATYKTKLAKELRHCYGMHQRYVRSRYAQLNPGHYMAAGTFSHLETGKKPFTEELEGALSQIYGVNPRLFKPEHFAD